MAGAAFVIRFYNGVVFVGNLAIVLVARVSKGKAIAAGAPELRESARGSCRMQNTARGSMRLGVGRG